MKNDERVFTEIMVGEIVFEFDGRRTFTREGFERFVKTHLRFSNLNERYRQAKESIREAIIKRTGSREDAAEVLDGLYEWRAFVAFENLGEVAEYLEGHLKKLER